MSFGGVFKFLVFIKFENFCHYFFEINFLTAPLSLPPWGPQVYIYMPLEVVLLVMDDLLIFLSLFSGYVLFWIMSIVMFSSSLIFYSAMSIL